LSHMVCATRSIESTLHAEPRMVMAVSRAYKPNVVCLLITSLGEYGRRGCHPSSSVSARLVKK
jgi:hypothetical protein